MQTTKKALPSGSAKIVEILHIDTVKSRDLYSGLNVNSDQKAKAQGFLKNKFKECCNKFNGKIKNWAGDGGFAFFPSGNSKQFGSAAKAATMFLESAANLNAQTARALGLQSFNRSVRIKAHRGEIFVTNDATLDSAAPEVFDDFVKNEKKFGPEPDDFFLTDEFYKALDSNQKNLYQFYKKIKAGSITTKLYRLKKTPVPKSENIFEVGDELSEITQNDWNYLKNQIISHRQNVAARNEITKGLILKVSQSHGGKNLISSKDILNFTLFALYNYLRIFSNHKFRLSFWRHLNGSQKEYIQMVNYKYPLLEAPSNPNRKLLINDEKYQVCCCFRNEEPIATPCVVSARSAQEWFDFDHGQSLQKRHLASALQIPIYYRNADNKKMMQGVLCLDSDKTDMFLKEEVLLWKEDLVGFLANISLSEIIYEQGG